MFITVVTPNEIRKCQQELESTLQNKLSNVGNFNIGFPGGSFNKQIHFNEKIWVKIEINQLKLKN